MESDRAPIEALSAAPLSRQQRAMLESLIKAYPRSLGRDHLFELLYQLDPNGGPDDIANSVAVRIHNIRKIIERFGWTIPRQRGGTGIKGFYRLAPIEAVKEVAA